MGKNLVEIFQPLWSVLPIQTEFWSAIAGALVGGFIAYLVQVKALREGRQQREADHNRIRQAQAYALLFKMIRISSNFAIIHRYIEGCFEKADQEGIEGEPWQLLLPLANLPSPVHFSSDEMGMLLSLESDEVFNLVVPMDDIHNSFIDAVRTLNAERRALTELLKPDKIEGKAVTGVMDREEALALAPQMINVNSLIEKIRPAAKTNAEESSKALDELNQLLKTKLQLTHELEPTAEGKM